MGNFVWNFFLFVFAVIGSLAIYDEFFGSPTVYDFDEYGYYCIALEDSGSLALWCEEKP